MVRYRSVSVEGKPTDELIGQIADNLRRLDDGYWISKSAELVSYPEDAHGLCYDLEADSFWFVHRNAVILQAIEQHPPEGPVFDIGGGNGCVSAAIQQAGYRVVLVEPGIEGVRNAVRRGLSPVVCSSFDEAQFRAGTIAAAGLFDVIEHVEDDLAFARSLRAVMRPGGRLYATVPALSWLWSIDDVRAGHFRRYTKASIEALLVQAGFAIEMSTYFFGFLVAPLFVRRSVPSFLGLRSSSGSEYVDEHRPQSSKVRRLIDRWSKAELARLEHGDSIRLGTSCLVVARASN